MISINSKYPEMIFRKEKDGKVFYSIGLSLKDANGNYQNGYMKVSFKKDVNVADRTKIIIKNGFVSFYKTKNGDTVNYLFITDYEIPEELKATNTTETKNVIEESNEPDPYEEMGKQIEITDSDLPF